MKKLLVLFLCGLVTVGIASELESLSYDARLSDYRYPFEEKTFEFVSQNQPLDMAYMVLRGDEAKPWETLLHGKILTARTGSRRGAGFMSRAAMC